ncbi:MAG: S9 family peptidase [Candidatus Zixiibacteriota bacterium]
MTTKMPARVLISVVILCGLLVSLYTGCGTKQLPEPPTAGVAAKVDTIYGEVRVDNYYWLRERDNPEVIGYLEAENAYTEAVMEHTEKLQSKLFEEMKGRIKETDLSVPYCLDEYFYYSRTEEGKQYKIYCRKQGSLDAEEEILLDANELAAGLDYFHLGSYKPGPNHQLLAYSVDTNGSETYAVYVKDLESGELFPDVIDSTSGNIEWANDSKTLFYTTLDEAKRPFKLYRHELGSKTEDPLIHHEKDDAFFLWVGKTRSRQYLLMSLGSMTTTEVHFLNADNPKGKFKVIHPRQHEMEYYADHHGDRFFIRTNDKAKNFKLVEAPVGNPGKKNWKTVIAHRDSVKLDDFDLFQDHLVIYERENGLRNMRVRNLHSGNEHYVMFPEPVYTFWPQDNHEFDTTVVRFSYMSLVTPKSVFDYDMVTKERELKKQTEVLGGYDPNEYQSERLFAVAGDGTRIPISIVYRKGMVKNGANPLVLYGYGAYGASMDPYFSSNRVSLLDRGFIYALAHIRGGGEMGEHWYDQGKMLNKKNTFTDFIACAEYLIAEKYTSPEHLIISGGSAGGLLMGAVTNMRPDLFKGVIADVPFVDVINTMLDPSIPLTVIEYEEWGNPNVEEYYDYIRSYSPYDNVEAKGYPNILITAGLNDPRVQYWEPAKWTAKLRATKTDTNRLLLKTNMGAGHGGASGRYDYLKEIAFEYAFILDLFGIRK